MTDRNSALSSYYPIGRHGNTEMLGLSLQEIRDKSIWQVATWPSTLIDIGDYLSIIMGNPQPSLPGSCIEKDNGLILRVEPLKWWLVSVDPLEDANDNIILEDLSHSKTHIRITGDSSKAFLGRLVSVDVRQSRFPMGRVFSTNFHHVGITICHSSSGYDIFIPRSFSLSIWHLFLEIAEQFGFEVI